MEVDIIIFGQADAGEYCTVFLNYATNSLLFFWGHWVTVIFHCIQLYLYSSDVCCNSGYWYLLLIDFCWACILVSSFVDTENSQSLGVYISREWLSLVSLYYIDCFVFGTILTTNSITGLVPCSLCININTAIDKLTCLAQCCLIFLMAVARLLSNDTVTSFVNLRKSLCELQFLLQILCADRVN